MKGGEWFRDDSSSFHLLCSLFLLLLRQLCLLSSGIRSRRWGPPALHDSVTVGTTDWWKWEPWILGHSAEPVLRWTLTSWASSFKRSRSWNREEGEGIFRAIWISVCMFPQLIFSKDERGKAVSNFTFMQQLYNFMHFNLCMHDLHVLNVTFN